QTSTQQHSHRCQECRVEHACDPGRRQDDHPNCDHNGDGGTIDSLHAESLESFCQNEIQLTPVLIKECIVNFDDACIANLETYICERLTWSLTIARNADEHQLIGTIGKRQIADSVSDSRRAR